jgi:hypothetical protein
MKKSLLPVFFLCILWMCPLFVRAADPGLPKWYGNSHFKITGVKDEVKVSINKMPWESFSVALEELVPEGGFLSLQVKAATPATLRIDGFTADQQQVMLFSESIAAGEFRQLYCQLPASQLTVSHLIFYVNPGQHYKGEVLIRDLQVKASSPREAIIIYPNPTANRVHIALPDKGFKEILIYDPQGKLILTKPVSGLAATLDLAGLPAGLYVIKATGGPAVLSSRLIVH